MSSIIGDTENYEPFAISDSDRRSGLYILGKPRMGKSWLIVNLILQDIENGHGVFFLDPHGDAIDDIIDRLKIDHENRLVLLNPEEETGSFGINPVLCLHPEQARLRNDTFTKAKGLFDKLWKNTFEEKPWLQLILQNTIYAFIETPGYTIAEFPMFFNDPAFREYIVSRIKYNQPVKDYWQKTFTSLSKHDQMEQMSAARTRTEIMIGHPYVYNILAQTVGTAARFGFRDALQDEGHEYRPECSATMDWHPSQRRSLRAEHQRAPG